jgi:hypothetical protein
MAEGVEEAAVMINTVEKPVIVAGEEIQRSAGWNLTTKKGISVVALKHVCDIPCIWGLNQEAMDD